MLHELLALSAPHSLCLRHLMSFSNYYAMDPQTLQPVSNSFADLPTRPTRNRLHLSGVRHLVSFSNQCAMDSQMLQLH